MASKVTELTTSSSVLQDQVARMIRYNQNRDRNLEIACTAVTKKALETAGYSGICEYSQRHFYGEDGKCLSEWDGVITAQTPLGAPVVIVVETKQLITEKNVQDICPRLEKTKKAIFEVTTVSNNTNLDTKGKILGQRLLNLGPLTSFIVVAGGPSVDEHMDGVIKSEGHATLRASGAGYFVSW